MHHGFQQEFGQCVCWPLREATCSRSKKNQWCSWWCSCKHRSNCFEHHVGIQLQLREGAIEESRNTGTKVKAMSVGFKMSKLEKWPCHCHDWTFQVIKNCATCLAPEQCSLQTLEEQRKSLPSWRLQNGPPHCKCPTCLLKFFKKEKQIWICGPFIIPCAHTTRIFGEHSSAPILTCVLVCSILCIRLLKLWMQIANCVGKGFSPATQESWPKNRLRRCNGRKTPPQHGDAQQKTTAG